VALARIACAEFEVKNEGQKQNIIAISKSFLFLVDSNDISATNVLEKITATGDGSNNSGSGDGAPSPPEANGGLGAEPPTLGRFSSFYQKI